MKHGYEVTNRTRNHCIRNIRLGVKTVGSFPEYRISDGMFSFTTYSLSDAEYLKAVLNGITHDQHLAALKGKEDAI